jgi:hypothetical protein|tara:strand:+ start:1396 stop:1653 length:258 start_codon:yes stop_codon:yes gene_type:complete
MTNGHLKIKYKLWCSQRQEYKTNFNCNDMIYDDLKEVENALYDFHSIDYGGLEEEEFNNLKLIEMLDIFDWEVHNAYTEKFININ